VSKGDLDGIMMFGRKIKPVAFGFVLLMLVYVWFGVTDTGTFDGTILGDIIGVLSAGAGALLIAGWWGRVQKLAEYGLLTACAVFGMRTMFLLLTEPQAERAWQGIGVCVIAVGAFLLERNDGASRRKQGTDAG